MNAHVDLSLAEFQRLCRQQIEYLDAISNLQSFQMIKIKTQIRNLDYAKRKNYNGRVYNIILTDGRHEVKAQSDLNIIQHLNDGDFVEVICFCQPNRDYKSESLEMSANIIAAQALNRAQIPQSIQQDTSLLKSLKLKPVRFPRDNQTIVLSLIYSSSSAAQVQHDFLNALGDYQKYIQIQHIQTRFNHLDEILNSIDKATGNVIAMIRGGGDSNALRIFDEDALLEKISALKIYRIAGIGHSADHNLINAVVDYSATTPTDAGQHLKEQLQQNNKDMWEVNKLKDKVKAYEQELVQLQKENLALQGDNQNTTPAQNPQNNNLIIMIVIIAVGLFMLYLMLK